MWSAKTRLIIGNIQQMERLLMMMYLLTSLSRVWFTGVFSLGWLATGVTSLWQ